MEADGVTSAIARAIRPSKHDNRHRAVALRAYIDGIDLDSDVVEFYLYQEILPGYAWIFSTGDDVANIGLGMRLDKFRQQNISLKEWLNAFLNLPHIKHRLRNAEPVRDTAVWQLNFGSQKLQYAFDGALLVGDAAGFINPLTGGGIDNAIISGILAAQGTDDALVKEDYSYDHLRKYEKHCHDAMWSSMRRSHFIQYWLLRFPFLLDILISQNMTGSSIAHPFLTKL